MAPGGNDPRRGIPAANLAFQRPARLPASLLVTSIVALAAAVCFLTVACDTGPSADLLTSGGVLSADDAERRKNVDEADVDEDALPAGSYVPGRLLVKFKPGTSNRDRGRILSQAVGARVSGGIPQIGVEIIELPPRASEVAQMRAFGQQAQVEFAELDQVVEPTETHPNDPQYAHQNFLRRIGAPEAWTYTSGSSDVIIAILDTGIETTHPDLVEKLVPGWNFYDNNADTNDFLGHGTMVAGVAGASTNNEIGVASVSWDCKLMPLRVGNPTNGGASYTRLAQALIWAADNGARVANMSYAPVSNNNTVTSAAQYLFARGGVTCASSGNSGNYDSNPDNPYILTISATNGNDEVTSWSVTGNNIDLAAPGTSLRTTYLGGTYTGVSGTSASAPVVAGAAALVISVNPSLTASQVQDILTQSADDLGEPGWDPEYGWGRVNAGRAVAMAAGIDEPPPDTTPPSVSISAPTGGETVSGTQSVQVSASDNVGVSSVALYIDGALHAVDNAAPYNFAWNTSDFPNGWTVLEAVAADAAGNTASDAISVNVSNVADTTPPTVVITSPAEGDQVRNNVQVRVDASDNVGVTRVELYVNGALQSTATSPPFTNRWHANRASNGAHTLQCRAYDEAGNVGFSQVVTVYK